MMELGGFACGVGGERERDVLGHVTGWSVLGWLVGLEGWRGDGDVGYFLRVA